LPFIKVMMRTFQLVGMQKKPATRMVLNIKQNCMLSFGVRFGVRGDKKKF
jgi:hypothetical protein